MLLKGRGLPLVPDLQALTELVRWRPGLYLRQSQGPEADMSGHGSFDYESGVEMPGLSVTTLDPEPWWPRSPMDWIARRVCKYADLSEMEGRHAWLLRGRIVGRGPDHEPLVVDVEPIAQLDDLVVHEARDHYHACFDVARDSKS
jgi:hypothetical protein